MYIYMYKWIYLSIWMYICMLYFCMYMLLIYLCILSMYIYLIHFVTCAYINPIYFLYMIISNILFNQWWSAMHWICIRIANVLITASCWTQLIKVYTNLKILSLEYIIYNNVYHRGWCYFLWFVWLEWKRTFIAMKWSIQI